MNRPADAEQAARRALVLEPKSLPLRYCLGRILAVAGERPFEAMDHLQAAMAEVPEAHLGMAHVLANAGLFGDAGREIQRYLTKVEGDKTADRKEAAVRAQRALNRIRAAAGGETEIAFDALRADLEAGL
jgi:predicted Zn-dependent protease